MSIKKWSSEEDEFLKSNYSEKSARDIGVLLYRTESSVQQRAERLGLRKTRARRVAHPGDVFGRWTVIAIKSIKISGRTYASCACSCGVFQDIKVTDLTFGRSLSCGCYARDLSSERERGNGDVGLNCWENSYKKGARSRNLDWNLSKDEFRSIIKLNCFWCGSKPKPWNPYTDCNGNISRDRTTRPDTVLRAWVNVNGIDRLDSSLGYFIKNCVPCCTECNKSKLDRSPKDFFLHCKRVVDHLSNRFK